MGRRVRRKREQDAIRAAENAILGPRLTMASCPRVENVLHSATNARLYELLDNLLDQEFVHPDEHAMARMAEKTLLVESVVRALKRYDEYHQSANHHTVLSARDHLDWTSDKAVAEYRDKRRRY